jgi:glycosyltransferase involved in cell wall biosynthesis
MRILFIAQWDLKKELGGPKVVLEIAEAFNKLGAEAQVVGPREIASFLNVNFGPNQTKEQYSKNIATYLNQVAGNFDVIDVEMHYLGYYEKEIKSKRPLIIARSVLLGRHFDKIKFPSKNGLKEKIKSGIFNLLHGKLDEESDDVRKEKFYQLFTCADLINVSNHKDVEQLIEDGYAREKILQFPYGIHPEKREALRQIHNIEKDENNIVFLGTFDFRKGCLHIPKVFQKIKENVPDATLTLLGSKGLFQTTDKMYKFFPKELRSSVSIIPEFKTEALPNYLKKFKIAIFPSYIEGFPFSVTECISSGIPVIAYNAPGASSMLPDQLLVDIGDYENMADKAIELLRDEKLRRSFSKKLINDSVKYDWSLIARDTIQAYSEALEKL